MNFFCFAKKMPCFAYEFPRNCLPAAIVFFVASTISSAADTDDEPIKPTPVELNRDVSYEQDVLPILKKNCIACHNSSKEEGELNMETAAQMIQGGVSGESIIPGDPDASYLYMLASRESEPVMPPLPNKMNAHRLSGAEVWKLRRWIELGAKGDVSKTAKMIEWSGVPAHLRPIYTVELFPQENQFAIGRGDRVEVISLLDPTVRQVLIDPNLEGSAHRDFVNAVAVHPNGRVLASAGYRNVKLWQQADPQIAPPVPSPTPFTVWQRSPNGQFLAAANESGTVSVVSPTTTQTWESGLAGITAVAVDDTGLNLAAAVGAELKVVNLKTPETVLTMSAMAIVNSLLFQPEMMLLAGQADGMISQWKIQAAEPQLSATELALKKHAQPVTQLRPVAGAVGQLVSLDQSGQVVLWDLTKQTPTLDWATGADTVEIAFHPNGPRLVSVHGSGKLIVWDKAKKAERELTQSAQLLLAKERLQNSVTVAKSLSTSAQAAQKAADKDLTDRKGALEKAQKEHATAVEAKTKAEQPAQEAAAKLEMITKKIADEGETDALKKELDAATKQRDEKQKLLDDAVQALSRAQKTLELEQASVAKSEKSAAQAAELVKQTAADLSAQEAELKSATDTLSKTPAQFVGARFVNAEQLQLVTAAGELQDWNLVTGQPIRAEQLPDVANVRSCVVTSDNQIVLITEPGLRYVNLDSNWKLIATLGPPAGGAGLNLSLFTDRVTALAFSPDGTKLATGGGDPSRDGELFIWDWQQQQIVQELPDAHSDVVLSLAYSRDGTKLLTGAADKFVRVLDAETGAEQQSFEGHTEHVLGVAWTADGLTVASSSADKSIKIWDLRDGSQKRTISSSGKQVTDLQFVGTTENVVSSSGDKLVRMYQSGNGRNYRNLSGSQNYLYSVAVTAGEEFVISGGQDGVVRIWDGKKGTLLHSLPVK